MYEAFPSYVVDEWLGHSTKTAETHYVQVTNEHWSTGASMMTGALIAGGPICANS